MSHQTDILFDDDAYDRGELVISKKLPYSDVESLTPEETDERARKGWPLEFGHTLDDQIGGQVEAGFVITGFCEDRYADTQNEPLAEYIAMFMATRALKTAVHG